MAPHPLSLLTGCRRMGPIQVAQRVYQDSNLTTLMPEMLKNLKIERGLRVRKGIKLRPN